MPGEKIPDGYRRCSAAKHEGERVLPESEFYPDRAQPSGFRSQCKACVSGARLVRREACTNAADARDERILEKAEREALKLAAEQEARAQRLASDHEALRPDDFEDEDSFDTSVANDAGSNALSKVASKQKRQEFNRQMGEHAANLRRAAIADMNGEADIVDAMPAKGGTYMGRLAEQERRFGNRRLSRSVSLFSAGEELARRLWIQACKQYLTGRVAPKGYALKKPNRELKRSVCVLLSDLHLGAELLAADNPQPFRKIEEARRLEYVMRQALDYKPQYREHSRLKLFLIGDMIEGLLMHDFRDGAPLTEQKVVFQKYFEAFIGECAAAYPGVDVHCVPGNHGRDKVRHTGRATSSKWDGHEWQMYYALSRACHHLKNVTFDLPFRAVGIVDLHGSTLGLSHGDTEVAPGDPDTKAKENAQLLDSINANETWDVQFDAWAFGHYHKPRYMPRRIRTIFNGALIPPNGHARTKGWLSEACGQFMWEAVEGYPIGDVRFIEVGRAQDHDERLGKIIEPFRFDLE